MSKNLYESIDEILKNQEELLKELREKRSDAEDGGPSEKVESVEAYSKRFFAAAGRDYLFCASRKEFLVRKYLALGAFLLFILFGVLSTVAVAKAWGFYSTYSLFENAWLLFSLGMAVNALRAKQSLSAELYERRSPYHLRIENGIPRKRKKKAYLRVFFVLFVIAALANALCCTDTETGFHLSAVLLEGLTIVFGILSQLLYAGLVCGYEAIRFEGPNRTGDGTAVYIYDGLTERMYKPTDWIYRDIFGK